MNDDEQGGRSHARPMARISTRDKRRNRRRKSKYNRPLISLPHGMVAVFLLLVTVVLIWIAWRILGSIRAALRGKPQSEPG